MQNHCCFTVGSCELDLVLEVNTALQWEKSLAWEVCICGCLAHTGTHAYILVLYRASVTLLEFHMDLMDNPSITRLGSNLKTWWCYTFEAQGSESREHNKAHLFCVSKTHLEAFIFLMTFSFSRRAIPSIFRFKKTVCFKKGVMWGDTGSPADRSSRALRIWIYT